MLYAELAENMRLHQVEMLIMAEIPFSEVTLPQRAEKGQKLMAPAETVEREAAVTLGKRLGMEENMEAVVEQETTVTVEMEGTMAEAVEALKQEPPEQEESMEAMVGKVLMEVMEQ